jgi:hypothetical protein
MATSLVSFAIVLSRSAIPDELRVRFLATLAEQIDEVRRERGLARVWI